MRTALLLVGLIGLSACAAAPKPEATSARSICTTAYNDPALDALRDKILFEDDAAAKASMNYLSDTRRPGVNERAALQHLDAANRRCWDAWDRVGTNPSITQARVDVNSALAQLYRGDSTYGDFNRQRAASLTRMYAALREDENRSGYGYGGSPFSIGLGVGIFR